MKKIFLIVVLIIIIPLLIVGLNYENIIYKNYGVYNVKTIRVKRLKTGNIETIPIEEYVIGVVAGEMPVSFYNEALKAQSVASRTYALNKIKDNLEYDVVDSTSNQVYLDREQLKENWGAAYEEKYTKVMKAVMETKGEVIFYGNEIIDAIFFSTSNGYTENSINVFSSQKPYLISVESKWDETESPVFNSINEVTVSEFLFALGMDSYNDVEINNIERTNTGRVISITINNKKILSSKVRETFNLRSTSFDIEKTGDIIKFNVKGFGHGVGMSQYGANGMAKNGNNYSEIIKYYYQNTEIKKIY